MKKIFLLLFVLLLLFCSCRNPEPEYPTERMEKAKNSAVFYLSSSSYSKSGLVALLEEKGYSSEESSYAAENCGADWYKQSAICAKELLEFSSFTKEALIFQLEIKGFTHEEAVYGAEQNGY
ncbi:MAG: Ltp family lipoprotein [Oscillospiraceae bacterium]|nr:Ltp family lipoprotein [Oscillospiraceae bacterium]